RFIQKLPPSLAAAVLAFAVLGTGAARATAPPVAGALPAELSEAFRLGAFAQPAPPRGLGASAGTSVWRIPVLFVSFSDDSITFGNEAFDHELFDSTRSVPTGSVYDYYQWASRGRLKVTGEVVARVRLPNTREYYAFNSYGVNSTTTPQNCFG